MNNGSGPDYVAITNQAVLSGQTNTTNGHILIAPAEETFTYDVDGNLLTDGLWDYTWDGENRLVRMASATEVPSQAVRWLEFAYDSQGRRISKTVSNWNGGWSLEGQLRFAYDDWNLLAELGGEDALLRSYLWGSDLSGSMQGAGGVGGLVAVKDAEEGCHFAAYDGNGNVVGLVDATDGSPSATYEYDPFGQRIRCSGDVAHVNPFQFATKYLDSETGYSYYGHRYYSPSLGRWLNRDPISERGGLNTYNAANNNLVNNIDALGMLFQKVRCIPGAITARGAWTWFSYGPDEASYADGVSDTLDIVYVHNVTLSFVCNCCFSSKIVSATVPYYEFVMSADNWRGAIVWNTVTIGPWPPIRGRWDWIAAVLNKTITTPAGLHPTDNSIINAVILENTPPPSLNGTLFLDDVPTVNCLFRP